MNFTKFTGRAIAVVTASVAFGAVAAADVGLVNQLQGDESGGQNDAGQAAEQPGCQRDRGWGQQPAELIRRTRQLPFTVTLSSGGAYAPLFQARLATTGLFVFWLPGWRRYNLRDAVALPRVLSSRVKLFCV